MKAGLKVRMAGGDATLWVSALDKNPIRRSNRLLVTHLTIFRIPVSNTPRLHAKRFWTGDDAVPRQGRGG